MTPLIVLGAFAVLVGGVATLVLSGPWKLPPGLQRDVAGRLPASTRAVALRLADEPCNRTLALQLADALAAGAEYQAVISIEAAFRDRCGQHEQMLRPLLHAQVNSSDLEAARRTADRLTREFPAEPSVWAWRAEVRDRLADFEGAVADYRRSLLLFSDPSLVAAQAWFTVARASAKAGAPCEAVLILRDYLAFDAVGRRTPQILTVMRDWQQAGNCPPAFGTGQATLRFDSRLGGIFVPVAVNGVTTRMMVDTGATRTVLTERLARRAGITASAEDGGEIVTGNGVIWLPGGRASSIAAGGATARNVPVWIQNERDGLYRDADGLLGLSFLGSFRTTVTGDVLELAPLE